MPDAGSPGGGHYLLLVRLPAAGGLRIGARVMPFAAGWYVYAGSAQGPGGLAARLARHQRAEKRPHWHIDWLLAAAKLTAIWARPGATGRECGWATALVAGGGRRQPGRFGSGDCRCAGHLVWFAAPPDLAALRDASGAPAFQPWAGVGTWRAHEG
jgi:Uri superfamily endonuclease